LGRPNTGKSTLLNTLLGTKVSIVSPRPQTTRTRLQGVLTRENAQVVFVDTPGTHRPMSRMNEQMMRSVRRAMDGIDLLLVVVDSSRSLNDEDEMAVQLAAGFSGSSFLVLNKIDLIDKDPRTHPGRAAAVSARCPDRSTRQISRRRDYSRKDLLPHPRGDSLLDRCRRRHL
jgi:GTP-binding protein Era